jgi:hypothetical protein
MLAALIATRPIGPPPPPPVVFYTNQLVAATTTFACIAITRQAAALTTSLPVQYILMLSIPGHECIFDQLNRAYFRLISPSADDSPAFLSLTISQVIDIAVSLSDVLQTLPVLASNLLILSALQQRLLLAIRVLRSLAVPPNALSFS